MANSDWDLHDDFWFHVAETKKQRGAGRPPGVGRDSPPETTPGLSMTAAEQEDFLVLREAAETVPWHCNEAPAPSVPHSDKAGRIPARGGISPAQEAESCPPENAPRVESGAGRKLATFTKSGVPFTPERPENQAGLMEGKRALAGRTLFRWALVAVAVAAVVAAVDFSSGGPPASRVPLAALAAKRAKEKALEVVPDIPAQQALVERFLAAASLEEKYGLVRPGVELLESMRQYYSKHPDEPAGFTLSSVSPGHHGADFCLLRGLDSLGKPLDVLVEKTWQGYRIDWRFLTGSGDMDWAEWLETRPKYPVVMRAEASAGSYYATPFTDQEKYLSVQLTDVNDQCSVWAYVDRQSSTGVTLAQSLKSAPRLRITAELAFPPKTPALQPGALLRRILPEGWKDTTLMIPAGI